MLAERKLSPKLIGLIAFALILEIACWSWIFQLNESARRDESETARCIAVVNKIDSISRLAIDTVGACATPGSEGESAPDETSLEKIGLEFQNLKTLLGNDEKTKTLVDDASNTALQHVRAAITLSKTPHAIKDNSSSQFDPFYAQIQNHELAVITDDLKAVKNAMQSRGEKLREKQLEKRRDSNNIQVIYLSLQAFALLLFVLLYAKKLTDRLNWTIIVLVFQLIGFSALLLNLQIQSDAEVKKTVEAVKATNALKEINSYFQDINSAIETNELTHAKVYTKEGKSRHFIHPLYEDVELDMIGRFVDRRHLISFQYELLKELKKDAHNDYAAIVSSSQAADRVFSILESMHSVLNAEIPAMKSHPIELSPARQAGWRKIQSGIKDIVSINFLSILKEELEQTCNSPKQQEWLRQEINTILLVECLIIFTFLGLIAHTVRSATRRINVMNDNAHRLASDLPLNPRFSGNDEISDLDKTFHAMADSLKEATTKERAIIFNASDVICSIDEKGHFSAVNPAARAVFGYTPDEMFGKLFVDFVFLDDKKAVVEAIDKLKNNQATEPIEARMIKQDGSLADTLWSATWSQSEKALFCVIHDITERKEAERLKQEVVAMITHDLRTPLSTIRNFHEMLATGMLGELTQKATRMLNLAERNAGRMLSLINDLLDVEKIKAGMMELEKENVSALRVLEHTAQSLSSLAAESGVAIATSAIQSNEDELVFNVDEDKISRVVTNLVSNAIKFSPRETTITLTAASKDGNVVISIQDQGRGIPQDKLAKIFDRFQQVSSQDHSKTGGSGLGLAICKAIVELHGGVISVVSDEGKGSTFKFTIPKA